MSTPFNETKYGIHGNKQIWATKLTRGSANTPRNRAKLIALGARHTRNNLNVLWGFQGCCVVQLESGKIALFAIQATLQGREIRPESA